jgi:nitrogen fixation protein FixH
MERGSGEPPDDRKGPRRSSPLWPAAIAGLLAIHALTWLVFTFVAVRDPSFAVEPDHYRKSMEWDAFAALLRSSDALGWSAVVETEPRAGILGDRRVAVRIADRDGKPVKGAAVSVVAFHHARGSERIEGMLLEDGDGIYAGRLRLRKEGLWECRLTARLGDARFSAVVLHRVGGSP